MRLLGGMFSRKRTPAEQAARDEPLTPAAVQRRVRERAEEIAEVRVTNERRDASAREIAESCRVAGHWWPRRASPFSASRLRPEPTVGDKVRALFDMYRGRLR